MSQKNMASTVDFTPLKNEEEGNLRSRISGNDSKRSKLSKHYLLYINLRQFLWYIIYYQ